MAYKGAFVADASFAGATYRIVADTPVFSETPETRRWRAAWTAYAGALAGAAASVRRPALRPMEAEPTYGTALALFRLLAALGAVSEVELVEPGRVDGAVRRAMVQPTPPGLARLQSTWDEALTQSECGALVRAYGGAPEDLWAAAREGLMEVARIAAGVPRGPTLPDTYDDTAFFGAVAADALAGVKRAAAE